MAGWNLNQMTLSDLLTSFEPIPWSVNFSVNSWNPLRSELSAYSSVIDTKDCVTESRRPDFEPSRAILKISVI